VDCPKCGQSLTVPTGDAMAEDLAELLVAAQSGADSEARAMTPAARLPVHRPIALDDMPLFERPDFENLLDPVTRTPDPLPLPPRTDDDGIPDRSSAAAPGHDLDAIVLSRTKATLIVVAVVVLLGLAFAAGFLIGG